MKRALILLPLLLASCGDADNTPVGAATQFLAAIKNFEVDKAQSYVVDGGHLQALEDMAGNPDLTAVRKALWGRMSFEVSSNQNAKNQDFIAVLVRVKAVDAASILEQVAMQRNNGTMFIVNAINSPDASMREDSFAILMHKEGKKWKVGDEGALNAVLLGLRPQ